MSSVNSQWYCPKCGASPVSFDDDIYEAWCDQEYERYMKANEDKCDE